MAIFATLSEPAVKFDGLEPELYPFYYNIRRMEQLEIL